MHGFLRWIGLTNTALWFGATLFFTVAVGPAFFSPEVLNLFGYSNNSHVARFYAGSVAQIVLERYYTLQCICASIAVLHLVSERLYTGRMIKRLSLYLVGLMFILALVGGFIIQPKLHQLHRTMYGAGGAATAETVQKARHSFGTWHGVSQVANLFILCGTLFYTWRCAQPETLTRFTPRTKFTQP